MKEIATLNRTKAILKKYGLHAKKGYGQNFIIDLNTIKKIADIGQLTQESAVIEIGPGIGALTEQLAQRAGKVIAFEIDKQLKPVLEETLAPYSNIDVYYEDFLKIDLTPVFNKLKQNYKTIHVVANLPYYITTPILMKLLESRLPFTNIVAMMQKEVAERLSANPGTKDYNSLSISVQYFCDVHIAQHISKKIFIPQPNVESAVVLFTVVEKDLGIKNETFFFEVVKACFVQRRKTILNNLAVYLKDKEKASNSLQKANIEPQTRSDALPIEKFVILANIMLEDNKWK